MKITVPEESFPSRGIKSDLNTVTEKPRDWLDFHISSGMKKLPSFVQDTDNMLQKIEKINESGIINVNTNLLGLDAVNMYNVMPTELSEVGVKEYLDTREEKPGQPAAESVIRVMKMCQENNNFQFKDANYR